MNMHFHRIASHIRGFSLLGGKPILPTIFNCTAIISFILVSKSFALNWLSLEEWIFMRWIDSVWKNEFMQQLKRNKNSNYYFYVFIFVLTSIVFTLLFFFCCFIAKCHCKHLFNIFRFSNQSSPFSVKECWLLFKWGFWLGRH
jgi:preprotein translocase subunit SecY